MTRQIVQTAALGTAVLLAGAASVAFGAEPYPNPHRIVRYLDAEADTTVNGVVNNGTIYKRGAGTATLPAPALNGGGSFIVSEGGVALDLDAAPAVPTLPSSLTAKIKLWLDPGVNIVVEDGLVTKWFDRRETNITDEVASYVYPYASSTFHWVRPIPEDDRRPSLVTSGPNLNGAYLDFGTYGTNSCKWLCITNSGVAGEVIRARELFVVCARRSDMDREGFTMFSACRGDAGSNRPTPSWVGGPNNTNGQRFWGSTVNTRADKGGTRLDRNPVWGGYLQLQDKDWHVVSTRLPNPDSDCGLNQIGLDRDLPQYSGGFVIAEVIMFEQRLSEFDRMRVEDYLWKKWMGSRQTSIGSVAVAAGAKVSATTSSDVTGALSGGGTFEKSGTGTATLVNDGFSGAVVLNAGTIRSENLPFAVKTGGQTLAAGGQGVVTRTDGGTANTFVKSGSGQLVVASLPATTTVQVAAGTLRISPPTPSAEFLAPAVFSNATFEAFTGSAALNVAGVAGTTVAKTNLNWVFDRSMYADGGALVMILDKSLYHHTTSHWNLQPEDSYGLGYEGSRFLYICHGRATGTFTIPASGIYRLSFALTSRDLGGRLKPMKLLLDGTDLRDYTAFDCYTFMRYEVALPWLAAGDHTLTFTDTGDDTKTVMMDDIKIVPVEAAAEAPVSVAIANPSFEDSWANVANTDISFKPTVANCTGWTMEDIQNPFASSLIMRRWFDGITAADNGLLAWPDEMAEGFLCAQIYGAARPISQDVTLPSAGRYRLTFHLAKRCGLSPQLVSVSVGGTVVKKVWVRHDDWKRYEAIFDVAEGGEKTLTFAGEVATENANVYTTGCAWLDDVALERVSETVPENLVSNGGFEVAGGGWTYNTCTNASATISWYGYLTNTPPMGADCAFMSGNDRADGSLRQDITFPAAGRYELSFRLRGFRVNPFGDDDKVSRFRVKVGDNQIWDSYVLRHEDERVVKQPFTVAEAGTQRLEFNSTFQAIQRGYVLLDDVAIVAAPAESRTDLADYIPETTELDVADGAMLNLDFDGVATVRGIRYNGRSYVGEISHATCPAWVMGRGVLSAAPRGTVILFR